MATYVTSDAHGHLCALKAALEQSDFGPEDQLYVLGDMIDRGPDPLGVVAYVRSLPNAKVLMGNHERMMLDALLRGQRDDMSLWDINGGWVTRGQFDELSSDEQKELLAWMHGLSLFDVVDAKGRLFVLAHAGFDPVRAWEFLGETISDAGALTKDALAEALSAQTEEDLLWIRYGFWDAPTGLVDEHGNGPLAVVGHTPSVNIRHFADPAGCDSTGLDESTGRGCIVFAGATEKTGWTPDKVDIDCSAAGGSEFGAVGVMRLNDFARWIVPVNNGE